MPVVSNVVTTGNDTGTKNGTVRFGLCLVFCLRHYYHNESKPFLYMDMAYSKFYSMHA